MSAKPAESRMEAGKGTGRSRLALGLFSVFWTASASVLLAMSGSSLLRELRTARWVETPCTFRYAEAVPKDTHDSQGYILKVGYSYNAGGIERSSTRYSATQADRHFRSVSERNGLLEKYAPGSGGVCLVDPANPAMAVLESRPQWGLAIPVAVALLFVCIGLALFASAAGAGLKKRDDKAPPWSERLPLVVPWVIGAVFAAVGISGAAAMARPLLESRSAKWQTTTATVESATLKTSSSDEGDTVYAPDIAYSYTVDGVRYENDAFTITETFGGHSEASRRAARYRAGEKTTVFYNPANPAQSFLSKPGVADFAFVLLPLLFAVVGVAVLAAMVRATVLSRGNDREARPLVGIALRRSAGREGGKLLFSIVWTTFTLVFATVWFTQSGPFAWSWEFWTFEKFFVMAFPAIGIVLLSSAAWRIVRHAATGHYEVTIAGQSLAPGERLQLSYRFQGRASKIDSVAFLIVQRNISTSPGGNADAPEMPGYELREEIHAEENPALTRQGSFVFTMPEAIPARKIAWSLELVYNGLTDTFRLRG